jgi:ribonuclease-3
MNAAADTPDPAELEARLGHRFGDRELLAEALTHRSLQRRQRPAGGRRGSGLFISYERLEFLGDRVLGLVVAEMLLERYPREPEGALTRRLAALVRLETLAAVAGEIDLAPHIRLPAIEQPSARGNPSLLADVCEAVIAALYLDGGFEAARRFILGHWSPRMEAAGAPPKDPKTALQEWAQARALPLPDYRLVGTEGPAHQPRFTIEVEIPGYPAEQASAASKRLAEAAAAAALLQLVIEGSGP